MASRTTSSPMHTRLGWTAAAFVLSLSALNPTAAFHGDVGSTAVLRTPPPSASPLEMALSSSSKRALRQRGGGGRISSMKLHYRDDGNVSNGATKWWPFTPTEATPTTSKSSRQDDVDEYLKFLDKRYKRLHEDELEAPASSSASSPREFSAMAWLTQPSAGSNEVTTEMQKDALYVLGVAGLASEKLLQQHHMSHVQQVPAQATSNAPTEGVIDAEVIVPSVDAPSVALATRLGYVLAKSLLVPVLRAWYVVQYQRQVIFRSLSTSTKKALFAAVQGVARNLAVGPRTLASKVLQATGGKRNIAFTLTVMTTLFFLLKPMVQTVIFQEGL